jgi:hypothetical protein
VRVKLDENVPHDAVAVFTDGGHDVHTIPSRRPCRRRRVVSLRRRAPDAGHVRLGFGDIRAYPPATHSGIVVLRLTDQRPDVVVDVLHRFLADYDLDTAVRTPDRGHRQPGAASPRVTAMSSSVWTLGC